MLLFILIHMLHYVNIKIVWLKLAMLLLKCRLFSILIRFWILWKGDIQINIVCLDITSFNLINIGFCLFFVFIFWLCHDSLCIYTVLELRTSWSIEEHIWCWIVVFWWCFNGITYGFIIFMFNSVALVRWSLDRLISLTLNSELFRLLHEFLSQVFIRWTVVRPRVVLPA